MRVGFLQQDGVVVALDGFPMPQDNVLLERRPGLAVAQDQLDVFFKGGANNCSPDRFQAMAENFPFRCFRAVVSQVVFILFKGFAVLRDVPTHS